MVLSKRTYAAGFPREALVFDHAADIDKAPNGDIPGEDILHVLELWGQRWSAWVHSCEEKTVKKMEKGMRGGPVIRI